MLIVVQHEPGEGPGSLTPFLGDARIVRTFAGEPVPDECDALVVLGGGMGAYEQDRLPHLREEIRLLRRCIERERPGLGIFLGSPLLPAPLGGPGAPAPAQGIRLPRAPPTAPRPDEPP